MGQTLSDEQKAVVVVLQHKIAQLGFNANFTPPVDTGPIVSVYRFQPSGSTRVSNIEGLSQDFAVALSAEDILAKRIPGEAAVGVFVPNRVRQWVKWYEIVGKMPSASLHMKIPLLLGIDHLGKIICEDLSTFPHLLVAGSTGGGKSTLLNSLLGTLVFTKSPREVQFVISDTKGVEFQHLTDAPHLAKPIASSIYTTLERMDWLLGEMNDRLKRFNEVGKRNILEFNQPYQDSPHAKARLPYIVFVIDELADLLLDRRRADEKRGPSLGQLSTAKLSELAAKARATGIHIIASTQRPSVKLLEGDVKSNFTARLSFRLPDGPSSRTVLGTEGAEHLLSRGDCLFINPNQPGLRRIHAPEAKLSDIQAALEFAQRRL